MADQRLAVVTGAAGGIGAAICERLAADGYRIAGLDLSEEGLQALTQNYAAGDRLCPRSDKGSRGARDRRAHRAGAGPDRRLGECPRDGRKGPNSIQEGPDYWRKVVAINYEALLYIAQPILLQMIGRKRGKMVFIASDAGRTGTAGQAVYAGAKGAVIAFAKSLARENARHNISINCVSPGPTETPLFIEEQREEFRDGPGHRARGTLPPGGQAGGAGRGRQLSAVPRRRLHHRPDLERERRAHD